MHARRRAELQLFAAALLFSTGGAAVKACSLTPWQIAGFRSGLALILILLVLPASRTNWNRRTFAVALAYAATEILFVMGNKLTTAANAIFLQSIAPLHIVLLGPWLLGERLNKRDLPPLLLAAVGLVMFFVGIQEPQATAPDPVRGNIVALAASVTWALTIMGLRWLGTMKESPRAIPMDIGTVPMEARPADPTITAVAIGNLLAFAALLPWALPIAQTAARDWIILAFIGMVQTGLTFILLTRAIPHVPALEVSLLLLIEPVANPIWAWLVHGETPGGWAIAGGALILAASILKTRREDSPP